jgi:hypothetical protein
MHSIWQEVKVGWREARWVSYFTLALIPSVFAAFLIAYLAEGKATTPPSPLTWLLCLLATVFSLYWAGLRSGLDSWLGRTVFVLTLWLIVVELIRQAARAGAQELQVTRRIGHYRVTIPMVSEPDGAMPSSQDSPPWWKSFRTALYALSRATWSPQ